MAKKIAIFADGTGNTVDRHKSNVLRLCTMLDLSEEAGQLAIYDPGVGTTTSLDPLQKILPASPRMCVVEDEARRPLAVRLLEMPLGLLFGLGTDRNIRQLYRELIERYEPDDQIYLFGFSRGAFTARALAGLIYRCGVLRREYADRTDAAIDWYQRHFEACEDATALRMLKLEVDRFKRCYSHLCDIRFLGVWDTVKSVGYIFPKNLPNTRHNPIVQIVRHALSLSERRSFYADTTWGGLDADTRPAIHVPAHFDDCDPPPIRWQDVQEVWFSGDHSDVGGGREPDQSALANVSLHWMVNEAHDAGLRVCLDEYSKIVPNTEELLPSHVHDEMRRSLGWKLFWGF